ncbi:putative quorum-sensing-regulated virulence factor [Alicyclobacillus dauci]|uniref:DUF3820 family protein n=1 Tax=Alicyclobacillus dauci TaxID=1475485 RepID=A0ABY6Z4Y5_9BACL|nr:DUF3820 family protein [Alicyclobacillus dauci]WAH37256.1 DUF3820 family protein [Alicyclobacillus dauci]
MNAASPIPIEVMPFGKHKGARMDEIPVSYFGWALQNMTELDSDLRIAREEQAASRWMRDKPWAHIGVPPTK